MKNIKKIIFSISTILLSMTMVACNNDKVSSDTPPSEVVIAKVGETEITLDKFNQEFNYAVEEVKGGYGEEYVQNEEVKENLKNQVIENLVNRELLLAEAEKQNIEISEEEKETEFLSIKNQFKTEEEFKAALEREKTTEDELKAEISENIKINKIISSIEIDTNVTDEEVEKYYNDNIEQFQVGAGADMSHILVKTEEEAKKIFAEYEAGAKFEELAAKYGTDNTKDKGGSLGFVEYDQGNFDKDFLAAAKELKEGEVSQPVKTQFGWHLIKVENIKSESTAKPIDELKPQITYFIQIKKVNDAHEQYIEGLKKDTKVKIYEKRITI